MLGPLLTLTYDRMGNSPSVPGPGGGRPHVKRDDSEAGSERGQKSEHSQIENTDIRIAEDFEEEEVDNRGDSLRVPESYVGYSKPTRPCGITALCVVEHRAVENY